MTRTTLVPWDHKNDRGTSRSIYCCDFFLKSKHRLPCSLLKISSLNLRIFLPWYVVWGGTPYLVPPLIEPLCLFLCEMNSTFVSLWPFFICICSCNKPIIFYFIVSLSFFKSWFFLRWRQRVQQKIFVSRNAGHSESMTFFAKPIWNITLSRKYLIIFCF